MKKLVFLFLLIPFFVEGQTISVAVQFRKLNPSVSALDSIQYTTTPAGAAGAQWFYNAAFLRTNYLRKSDSLLFVTPSFAASNYYNKTYIDLNVWKKPDTVSALATQYYVEHAPHTFYGSQLFKGNVEVQGGLLYVRPNSGTYPYVYADNSTINANGTGGTVLLNGNSQTVQWNIGSFIGALHADNMTGNRVWYMPNKSDTLATKGDIPGGGAGGTVVNSFNSRTGLITPQSGDYSAYYANISTLVNSQALSANILVNQQSTKTNSNLDATLWYLPKPTTDDNGVTLSANAKPVSVLVNGKSISYLYDSTTTPARIYGFDNPANTQTIKVIFTYAQ